MYTYVSRHTYKMHYYILYNNYCYWIRYFHIILCYCRNYFSSTKRFRDMIIWLQPTRCMFHETHLQIKHAQFQLCVHVGSPRTSVQYSRICICTYYNSYNNNYSRSGHVWEITRGLKISTRYVFTFYPKPINTDVRLYRIVVQELRFVFFFS